MLFYDYHTHTDYSPDAVDSMDKLCASALKMNICEIAFTDHVECNGFEGDGAVFDAKQYSPLEIKRDILRLRGQYEGRLKILFGVELGQPLEGVGHAKRLLGENDYDFVIASCHNLAGKDDFYYMDYGKTDTHRLMGDYLDHLSQYARWGGFDVLGHLTYPLRYMSTAERERFSIQKHEEKLRALFLLLAQKGLGLELNTSGFRTLGEPMPGLWVLRLFREMGGEVVTIGSDAHRSEHLAYRFDDGLELLRSAGFKSISTFEQRKMQFVSI